MNIYVYHDENSTFLNIPVEHDLEYLKQLCNKSKKLDLPLYYDMEFYDDSNFIIKTNELVDNKQIFIKLIIYKTVNIYELNDDNIITNKHQIEKTPEDFRKFKIEDFLSFYPEYKNKTLYSPINYSTLKLNGVSLSSYDSNYYNYVQPYNYYNASPSLGVNAYSFSLNPLEVQPSGSCNFSRIPKISLEINLIKNINDFKLNNEYNLEIIGTNYNILRIIGGIAGLAYTY